jgi:hypothetical protein
MRGTTEQVPSVQSLLLLMVIFTKRFNFANIKYKADKLFIY